MGNRGLRSSTVKIPIDENFPPLALVVGGCRSSDFGARARGGAIGGEFPEYHRGAGGPVAGPGVRLRRRSERQDPELRPAGRRELPNGECRVGGLRVFTDPCLPFDRTARADAWRFYQRCAV